jgi:hypothetical protein
MEQIIVLWPLFHYILWDEATDGRQEKKNWDDYVFVNQQFADTIVEQYRPGDVGECGSLLRHLSTQHDEIARE